MFNYTFDELKEAVEESTSFTLRMRYNKDEGQFDYELVDGFGDVWGDAFYTLEDVYYYVMDNEDVAEFMNDQLGLAPL